MTFMQTKKRREKRTPPNTEAEFVTFIISKVMIQWSFSPNTKNGKSTCYIWPVPLTLQTSFHSELWAWLMSYHPHFRTAFNYTASALCSWLSCGKSVQNQRRFVGFPYIMWLFHPETECKRTRLNRIRLMQTSFAHVSTIKLYSQILKWKLNQDRICVRFLKERSMPARCLNAL